MIDWATVLNTAVLSHLKTRVNNLLHLVATLSMHYASEFGKLYSFFLWMNSCSSIASLLMIKYNLIVLAIDGTNCPVSW
jgi:hypothetical protein